MSLLFNFARPPFDCLDEAARQQLGQRLSICYFRAGQTVQSPGRARGPLSHHQGAVEVCPIRRSATTARGTCSTSGPSSTVAAATASPPWKTPSASSFPRPDFLALCDQHPDIARYFTATLAERQREQERRGQLGQQNLAEFILTRMGPGHLQPALQLDSQTSLLAATEAMVARGTDCLLYPAADGSQSLATRKTLLHALTLRDCPHGAARGADPALIGLAQGSYLFDALLLMTRHRIQAPGHLAGGQEVAGILHLTRVLGLFSAHSHVLTLRIARADSPAALEAVAGEQRLIAPCLPRGIPPSF